MENESNFAQMRDRSPFLATRVCNPEEKMDSRVTVFELQNDCSVKQHEVPLTFPRASRSRLGIVTNQRTQQYLLKKSEGSPRPEEVVAFRENIFQYGVSTKVFAITDATGAAWEVRLLLSPSEIARLSSNFNLTGFVSGCLMIAKYQDCLSSLSGREAEVQELCMAAAQFLSFSEDNKVNDYCKDLKKILTEKIGASCTGQQRMDDMLAGALVALAAAELATSIGGSKKFDYKIQKEKNQEDQSEQIQEMVRIFDVEANLLTVSHQGKRVQIIFRNPCPDNWASGGKKSAWSGETFVFGLCHKVVSISEATSEIQFLQNWQESYDLVPVFHLPAFVEHLLMTSSWRNKIELFLKEKDQRKDMIHELSTLAVRFICSKTCHQETFLKEFRGAMLEKWSSLEALLVADEVVCCFGILVAILAALTVKNIADRHIIDSEEEEGSIITKVIDEHGGAQPDLGSSPDHWDKIEHEIDEVGMDGAESKTGSTNDPVATDQEGVDDSFKAEEPLSEATDIGIADIPDHETDRDDDENFSEHPSGQERVHESSPTNPDTEGGPHSQGRGGGPSLDDSYEDGALIVEDGDKALETQVSSLRNKVFYTSCIGLACLLAVAAGKWAFV